MAWFSNILDGVTNFFDPLHILIPSGAQNRNEARQDATLKLQQTALKHQMDFDTWSQGFAQQQFDVQKDLAYNSPAIGLKSVGSMGVNPIVASGASAGSVGVSSPSSSADSPNSTSPVSNQSGAGSLLGVVGSLIGTKMQGNTQKQIVEDELASNERIAQLQNDTKNRELDIQEQESLALQNKWKEEINIATSELNVKQGQLQLERQKRLDEVTQFAQKLAWEKAKEKGQRRDYYELKSRELRIQEGKLQESIRSNDVNESGNALRAISVITASILGGPTAGMILNYIAQGGKNPVGFVTGR